MATIKKKKSDEYSSTPWPFGRKNYLLLGISLGIILIGYICLASGDDANDAISITLAPVLLVIGYGLIPYAILARSKSTKAEPEPELPKQE